MSTLEDIKDQLRSEKVTVRKKARAECEARLLGDRVALAGNNVLTMGFMQSAIEYELMEINLAQTKGKPADLNVSTFYRNLVRYCISYGLVKSHSASNLLDHAIDILCNEDLSSQYINNHKNTLVVVLQPSVVHGLSFDKSLKALIIYLKEVMLESGLKDPLNHKLLKAACVCMFREDSSQPSFLSGVIGWFGKLLQQSSEDPQLHASVAATVAECCAAFLEYQSITLLHVVYKELESVLQVVVKYVSAYQYREQHKDSYFHFLDKFLDVGGLFHEKAHSSMLDSHTLGSTLAQLCEYFFSDTHLRSIVVSMRAHPAAVAASKDPHTVTLPELLTSDTSHKWMAPLSVMSKLVVCCGLAVPGSERDHEHGASDERAASGRKTSRQVGEGAGAGATSEHAAKRQRNVSGGATAVPTGSSAQCTHSTSLAPYNVFLKIASVSLDSSSTGHGNPSANSGTSKGAVATSVTAMSSVASRQTAAHVLEGCLVLMTVTLRNNSTVGLRGVPSVRGSSITPLYSLIRWVELTKTRLEHVLQYGADTQLVGALLLLLIRLAQASTSFVHHPPQNGQVDKQVEALRAAWLAVLATVHNNSKLAGLFPTAPSVRRDSVVACATQLTQQILSLRLLDARALAQVEAALWVWPFLAQPMSIESPVGFSYLAACLAASRGDVPADVLRKVCVLAEAAGYPELAAVFPAVEPERRSPLTVGGSGGLVLRSTTDATTENGAMSIALWLMAQLSPPQYANTAQPGSEAPPPPTSVAASANSLTRVPVNQLASYATAFDQLIAGFTVASAGSVTAIPNTKQNPLHWIENGSAQRPANVTEAEGATTPAMPPAQLERLLAMLDVVKQHLVAAVTAHGVKSDASDQFTAWQSVALLTLAAYGSAAVAAHAQLQTAADGQDTHTTGASLQTLRTTALGSCLALVKALVLYTERKLPALKVTQVAELFCALSGVLLRIQPALQGALQAQPGAGDGPAQLARLRAASISALLKAIRTLNSVVMNKVRFDRAACLCASTFIL
jgi:hypothetical protein